MTLRDYFAAHAIQGMYANHEIVVAYDTPTLAEFSFEVADAMLAARGKERA